MQIAGQEDSVCPSEAATVVYCFADGVLRTARRLLLGLFLF